MKKRLLALLLVMILVVASFSACGGGSGIEGKWQISSMEAGGQTIDYKALLALAGDEAAGIEFYLDVKSDGTFEMNSNGDKTNGTWKKDGSKYFLVVEGEEVEAKLSDGKLTMEQEGTKIVFEK